MRFWIVIVWVCWTIIWFCRVIVRFCWFTVCCKLAKRRSQARFVTTCYNWSESDLILCEIRCKSFMMILISFCHFFSQNCQHLFSHQNDITFVIVCCLFNTFTSPFCNNKIMKYCSLAFLLPVLVKLIAFLAILSPKIILLIYEVGVDIVKILILSKKHFGILSEYHSDARYKSGMDHLI